MAGKRRIVPKFSMGEFVDVLKDGVWQEGVVETVNIFKKVLYSGCLINTATSFMSLENNLRPSENFQKMLEEELSQEMPDLTQKETEKMDTEGTKDLWQNDANNFVNPAPMIPPKRFKSLSDEQLNDLAYQSKAKNTHKHTKWGIKVFRGRFHIEMK